MTSRLHPLRCSRGALLAFCLSLTACSTSSQEPAGAPEESPPFDSMSKGQKLQHMKKVVTPEMAKVFAHSPEEEEEGKFSCETCHGEGASSGDFEMPTSSLPLNDEEIEEHPKISKFMADMVVPKMKELLGEGDFSCYDCHTKTH